MDSKKPGWMPDHYGYMSATHEMVCKAIERALSRIVYTEQRIAAARERSERFEAGCSVQDMTFQVRELEKRTAELREARKQYSEFARKNRTSLSIFLRAKDSLDLDNYYQRVTEQKIARMRWEAEHPEEARKFRERVALRREQNEKAREHDDYLALAEFFPAS